MEERFGQTTELVRVSSTDRAGRFLVAQSRRKQSRDSGGMHEVVLLGRGDSYASAYASSLRSEEGIRAAEEFFKVKELIRSAATAPTAAAFADDVMRATLDEAKANGFSEEQLEELKKKFEAAREKINDGRKD